MVNVLELTLESAYCEVIVNSGIGSHTLYTVCFSLNTVSDRNPRGGGGAGVVNNHIIS